MKTKHFSFFVASLLAVSIAQAAINIDTVLVGDAGNPGDPLTDGNNSNQTPGGFGSVNYNYYIGIYEVTNAQYAAFLNSVAATDTHGLYTTIMGSNIGSITRSGTSGNYSYSTIAGRENNPVNFVSFWDAARFANWLTNGQPTGVQDLSTTETGMYFLNGVTNPVNTSVTRLLDFSAGQNGVAIANENEWYKAAYYSGSPIGADGDGYWLYPTQSNTPPTGAEANYNANDGNEPYAIADVGYSLASHYGTFDQGGNLLEWNDGILLTNNRVQRGGSMESGNANLRSLSRNSFPPANERFTSGFRVTSLEPITDSNQVVPVFGLPWLVLLIASMLGLGYRKIR